LLHLENGLSPEEVVAAVDRATEQCRATGIEARLILCTLQHFRQEQSLLTAKLVERFSASRVVALDLAGDEAWFPLNPHIPAFRFALDRGINRTAHAGEAAGPASVWETLRAFEPTRIGHGVRSIEDPKLIEYLRAKRIHLELCPSSNVQTCVCSAYHDHPANRLLRAGVSVGINTDARTITNVTPHEEYARLREQFGWSETEFRACNRAAFDAAYMDEPVKRERISRLLVS